MFRINLVLRLPLLRTLLVLLLSLLINLYVMHVSFIQKLVRFDLHCLSFVNVINKPYQFSGSPMCILHVYTIYTISYEKTKCLYTCIGKWTIGVVLSYKIGYNGFSNNLSTLLTKTRFDVCVDFICAESPVKENLTPSATPTTAPSEISPSVTQMKYRWSFSSSKRSFGTYFHDNITFPYNLTVFDVIDTDQPFYLFWYG